MGFTLRAVFRGEGSLVTGPHHTAQSRPQLVLSCDGRRLRASSRWKASALMDGSVFSMTGPWDSDRDRVQRDFGFSFDFEARGRANFEASVQAPGRL